MLKQSDRLELSNDSHKLADEIKELQLMNHKFQKELVQVRENLTDLQDHIMEKVLKATYNDGRKKYRSDIARKAAVRSLIKLDKSYLGLILAIKNYESAITINNIEIEHSKRIVKVNRAFLYSESRI